MLKSSKPESSRPLPLSLFGCLCPFIWKVSLPLIILCFNLGIHITNIFFWVVACLFVLFLEHWRRETLNLNGVNVLIFSLWFAFLMSYKVKVRKLLEHFNNSTFLHFSQTFKTLAFAFMSAIHLHLVCLVHTLYLL